MADDVSLPDLEVIQRFSLAVRSASAPRADVIAALEADLAALRAEAPSGKGRPAPSARRSAAAPITSPRSRPA